MSQSTKSGARWQPMSAADIDAVVAIADVVHPGFPENRSVLAERLRLYPDGCFMLCGEADGNPVGYALSHPWEAAGVPLLNCKIGELPVPEVYYIHDIALLPEARGLRASNHAVALIETAAARLGLQRIALVAVNNSAAFWQRHGFIPEPGEKWSLKLASYGDDAAYMVKKIEPGRKLQ